MKQESLFVSKTTPSHPLDTERKLNVHKTFRRRPGRLMYVHFTSCVQGGWYIDIFVNCMYDRIRFIKRYN